MLYILILLVGLAVLATVTGGENTAPTVEVHTPVEGAALGLSVTVSGKASDAEGFNIESYVEARWNDWEWFRLPNTPADGNRSIVFGEMVNLDWHSPGGHLLQVRAFDGEMHSAVAEVNVTVRDLPDLVILPTDITIKPGDVMEGDKAIVYVLVRNQGGEDVPEVEVTLYMDGIEVGRRHEASLTAGAEVTVSFKVGPDEGNVTFKASVHSLQTVEEKSHSNNEAERSFPVQPAVTEGDDWNRPILYTGITVLVMAILLVIFYSYSVVTSRQD